MLGGSRQLRPRPIMWPNIKCNLMASKETELKYKSNVSAYVIKCNVMLTLSIACYKIPHLYQHGCTFETHLLN